MECRFTNCVFSGTAFPDCKFVECTFTNCQFLKGNLNDKCDLNALSRMGAASKTVSDLPGRKYLHPPSQWKKADLPHPRYP